MKSFNKKYVVICGLVILLLVINYIVYSTNLEKFNITSWNSIQREALTINENIYFGYGLNWQGNLRPSIQSVKMRKKDGTILTNNDKELSIETLIDENGHTGTLREEDVQEYNFEYLPTENYKFRIDKPFTTLVLRVDVKDPNYENNLASIDISYKVLWFDYIQTVEYNGFTSE